MNPKKTSEVDVSPPKTRNSGLIVVITAIGLVAVASLVIPSLFPDPTQIRAQEASARQQIAGLVNAVRLYETAYSALPISSAEDERTITTDAPFTDILTGADLKSNPKAIVFIEGRTAKKKSTFRPRRAGFIEHGNGSSSLVDPWGNHYMIRMDLNDDGFIEAPDSSGALQANVICWSYGAPKNKHEYQSALDNDPADWISSWR